MVHLLLEKGQSPGTSKEHVPMTSQSILPDPDSQGQDPDKMKKMIHVKDYSFVTEGQALSNCHLTFNFFVT